MISSVCKRIRWCPIASKPPVPIPNTVVKTCRGENTWRATSWEDSTMPASILRKRTNLMDFKLVLFLLKKCMVQIFAPKTLKRWESLTLFPPYCCYSYLPITRSRSFRYFETGLRSRKATVINNSLCNFECTENIP